MTHNGFHELIQINSWLKMVFWNLIQIDSWLKQLSRVLIQIDSWLKKLSRVLIQINSQLTNLSRIWVKLPDNSKNFFGNIDSNQLMTQLHHYGWANVTVNLTWCDLLGLSTQTSFCEIDSNQFMTQAVSWRHEKSLHSEISADHAKFFF